ncbi:hypothetical protein [Legionella maioricensis]|nr:hypothetical protein [Legionella maioricensis]
MNGLPCLHHMDLLINNLLGSSVPMTGQIPYRGQVARVLNTTSMVIDKLPEAEDFLRWSCENFTQNEHAIAVEWRNDISTLDLDTITNAFKSSINQKICPSLQEAKSIAESLVNRSNKSAEDIQNELSFLGVRPEFHNEILKRWTLQGSPPLSSFAPYAAYMLTLETFFYIARAAGLIPLSTSSWMDLNYLYYLPFCMIFVSSDKLHKRCAPLFMRKDQHFVWGEELKKDLASLDAHYHSLPDEIKKKGISFFANKPPKKPTFLVTELWDKFFPGWQLSQNKTKLSEKERASILEEVNNLFNLNESKQGTADIYINDTDSLLIKRKMRKQKGSWVLLNEGVLDKT